ncbi:hypothetical protein [Desulfopila sp. IMCC35008]|uniref:hypothetical protein n=1 Tax=Desulfopila sp. IMCC35008 TaxID=2653858 RepID=UPI0013CF87CD|nr:hypothetical protein [Desulfopila sp. IMCC35008]
MNRIKSALIFVARPFLLSLCVAFAQWLRRANINQEAGKAILGEYPSENYGQQSMGRLVSHNLWKLDLTAPKYVNVREMFEFAPR